MKTKPLLFAFFFFLCSFAFTACKNEPPEPATATYTAYGEIDNILYAFTLVITENIYRAAYSPQERENYEFTVSNAQSGYTRGKNTGTVKSVSGETFTLEKRFGAAYERSLITITVSGNAITAITTDFLNYNNRYYIYFDSGDNGADGGSVGIPDSITLTPNKPN